MSGCNKSIINNPPKDTENIQDPISNDDEGKDEITYKIKDYYPFKPNTKYIYEGNGMEYASYTTFVDYVKDNRIQLRVDNGGTVVSKVIENKDGQLQVIQSKGEVYYRENLTSKEGTINEILLKEPLVKGTSWTLPDGKKRYISNTDIEVTTPLGTYKTIEITTEGKDYKNIDYYALNIGLVKTVYSSNDSTVTSSLSKIEENLPFVQNIKFYYPNIAEDKMYFAYKNISFNTNNITKSKFEKTFKESLGNNIESLLGPNVKINSLYLNKDNVVYVDFSKEFTTQMNAGSGYELMILQCITNTLGEYYGVNKVYITIENKPYSSGHILMKKGEPFIVNTENSIQYK
jgi:spore germination protein GerM